MGTTWYKTDYKGVRYRKHPARKHGVKFDQYFTITYKLDGATKSEAIGWASEGHTASEAFEKLCELKKTKNQDKAPALLQNAGRRPNRNERRPNLKKRQKKS